MRNQPPTAPAFAEVCAALAEPLRAFLNHPDMDKGIASEIAEQLRQLFPDYAPEIRPGDYAAEVLSGFADVPPSPDAGRLSTAPAWIAPLCNALADALEDEQLSEEARNRLTELVNDIDQQHTADYSTIARRMLPVALTRARVGADQTAGGEA